jgi:prepilin-type N-terminal cleavage/methylation domain-containing protein
MRLFAFSRQSSIKLIPCALRLDCHASFHSARNDNLKNIRNNGKGNNAKSCHAELVSASVFDIMRLRIPRNKYGAKASAMTKTGFTLIELLVVVVIIGILAAIALPQYNFAVEKARVSTALRALKALKESQERYYMANGTYGKKEDLDISVNDTKYFAFQVGGGSDPLGAYKVYAFRKYKTDTYFLELYANGSNTRLCHPHNDIDLKICQHLGCPNPQIGKWCYFK